MEIIIDGYSIEACWLVGYSQNPDTLPLHIKSYHGPEGNIINNFQSDITILLCNYEF